MQIFSVLPVFRLESALAAELVAQTYARYPGSFSVSRGKKQASQKTFASLKDTAQSRNYLLYGDIGCLTFKYKRCASLSCLSGLLVPNS